MLHTECPVCGYEEAYFDGVRYVCDDCGAELDVDNCTFEEI